MNILRMKYFVDVAQFKNFTRAAEYNYVSQTAVSQQIAAVERELEVQLFNRDKGKVTLTPAGESFYEDCVRFLSEYEKAVAKVKRIQNENGGTISIGFLTAIRLGFLYDIIQAFHKTYPNVTVKLVQNSFNGLRRQLESGELDVALALVYNLTDIPNVNVKVIKKLKMGLLVSNKHPLAVYDSISASMVKDYPIVMTSRKFAGKIYDHMLEQRQKEGYVPNIVETADSSEILTMLVELNRGVAFLPERISVYNSNQCKMLPIYDNDDYAEYAIAWQKGDQSEALGFLVNCIEHFYCNQFDEWVESNCNQ